MRRILILIFSFLLLTSCLGRDAIKKKEETKLPPLSNEAAIRVYKEGLENLKDGDYFMHQKNLVRRKLYYHKLYGLKNLL